MHQHTDSAARRLAARQGLRVVKTRTERYAGCGTYYVVDADTRFLVSSEFGMHLEELHAFLRQG